MRLLDVAERFAWRARGARVAVICGLPASGKSRLASALASGFDLEVLSSDVIRKELAGLPPAARADASHYDESHNLATYAQLGRRAAELLAADGGVIVDASFRHQADRETFLSELGSDTRRIYIECVAPPRVLLERAAARQQEVDRVSDATVEVVERERRSWVELDEVTAAEHVMVRTDRGLDLIVADVLALLDERLYATVDVDIDDRRGR